VDGEIGDAGGSLFKREREDVGGGPAGEGEKTMAGTGILGVVVSGEI
jgi:hypothetical protein